MAPKTIQRIGLDLDDVISDNNRALCDFCNEQHGTSLRFEDLTSYFLEEVWGCSREEAVKRVLGFFRSPAYREVAPVAGAIEGVRFLQKHADCVIVTSRPEEIRPQTTYWLNLHLPELVDRVHFTGQFTDSPITKGGMCRELNIDLFVDDSPGHIEDVGKVVRHALLFDAPWNRRHRSELSTVRRVRSWKEVCSFVECWERG